MRTEIDLAYAAGIVDGEGCVTIISNSFLEKGRKCPRYKVYIQVAVTDFNLIDWLYTTFGGSIRKKQARSPFHKDQYEWRMTGSSAVELLGVILPYLKIKRKQAELAIRFYKGYRRIRHRRGGTPEEELERRLLFKQEMQKLNKRGRE